MTTAEKKAKRVLRRYWRVCGKQIDRLEFLARVHPGAELPTSVEVHEHILRKAKLTQADIDEAISVRGLEEPAPPWQI